MSQKAVKVSQKIVKIAVRKAQILGNYSRKQRDLDLEK